MTTNGLSGQYVPQVAPLSDPCPNCGIAAQLLRGELKLEPEYIHRPQGQPRRGAPVWAYTLCLNCMYRTKITWVMGVPAVTVLAQGDPQEKQA